MGYIPRNTAGSHIDTLRFLTSIGIPKIEAEHFITTCSEEFGIARSSAKTLISTVRGLGLYEPAGRAAFKATPAAIEWINGEDDIALIRIIHCNVRFVGEILRHVDELKRANKLHELGRSEYGVESPSSGYTARLLTCMNSTGLIREVGYAQFEATELGRKLADSLPLSQSKAELGRMAILSELEVSSPMEMAKHDHLAAELREASLDSSNPARFEKAIARAFEELGVSAAHVGGPGKTDVLVELGSGSLSHGRAIVDGKSSGSGIVDEKAINFQALRGHRTKHSAQFAAVVAPSFLEGRLQQYAIDEKVALIDVERLIGILQRQIVTPLSPSELVLIFDAPERWDELDTRWGSYDRANELVRQIVRCLEREAEEDDPLLGPSLDIRGIYREIRGRVHPYPTTDEIHKVLSFLESPLVRLVTSDKNGYSLLEPPIIAALRLRSIAGVLPPAEA